MQQARDNDSHDESDDTSDLVAESQQARPEPEQEGGPSRALGLSRWVQYVFVVIAAVLFWIFDKIANLGLQTFMDPNPELVTGVSLVLGGVIAQRLYANERSHRLVTEIIAELSKVTWPSREETYASSVIVIITSLIAAAIVGGFDFVWSAITDLLYKYKV